MSQNPYIPMPAKIIEIHEEAGGPRAIRRLRVQFLNAEDKKNFNQKPGQCAVLSIFGKGESLISITSPSTIRDYLEFAVMRVGKVTTTIHQLEVGDIIGVRGPYGNSFPVDDWKGKDLIFIGAGIGQAPIRSVYNYVLAKENRENYGRVTLIYGARTSKDLSFKDELFTYEKMDDPDVYLCVDWKFGKDGMIDEDAEKGWTKINMKSPGDTSIKPGQTRFTCFVPQLVEVVKPKPDNTIAITCGPPIAIKFITQNLSKLGFDDDQIYTTLEMRMKCGIGKCGRCNIGKTYVCVDGPVFTFREIKEMPQEY